MARRFEGPKSLCGNTAFLFQGRHVTHVCGVISNAPSKLRISIILRTTEFVANGRATAPQNQRRLFALGREFRIGNVNAISVKQPIPHFLGFTKFRLCQFGCVYAARRLDLNRTLADLGFMPVVTEDILHKSSNIACHSGLLTRIAAAFSRLCSGLLHVKRFTY
jgi:hypothetical protein